MKKKHLILKHLQTNRSCTERNYVTKLLFKNTDDLISDNYQLWLERLESLKRSLDKVHTLLTDYNEIIKNYLEKGIIEKT